MKRILFSSLSGVALLLLVSGASMAVPDYYLGDSAIYGGSRPDPNVLFVIDNSAGMSQPGLANTYDSTVDYSGIYSQNAVYVRQAATGGTINYNGYIASIDSVTCTSAATALNDTGAYYGPLKKNDGSCNTSQSGNYYLGNFLNYLAQPSPSLPDAWEANHLYAEGDMVSENGKIYFCAWGGTSGATEPVWPTVTGVPVIDNGMVVWYLNPDTIVDMVENTVAQVTESVRAKVRVGLMVFGDNNHGAKVVQPVQDISVSSANILGAIESLSDSLLVGNLQPINESLWDAGLYFRGRNNSVDKISSDKTVYPSPAQYTCQKNFIIVLTTGSSPDTEHTKSYLTDLNENGTTGDAADAAIYNLDASLNGTNSVQTKVIQMLSAEVPILKTAAIMGHEEDSPEKVSTEGYTPENGKYFHVNNAKELTDALHKAMVDIVKEVDTSFVAPVVPASPENRTYSGQRIYLGFFKPVNGEPWYGNLKKFGLSSDNQIVAYDSGGNLIEATDAQGYFLVDDSTDPPTPVNRSFWTPSDTLDGGLVDEGGVGGLLLSRATARNIYTYLAADGVTSNLYDSAHAFALDNSSLTASMLGLDDGDTTARNQVINFVHGYEEDGTTKRTWILGDILHSKPLIVNYANYGFSEANEANGSLNKTMVFFGANDGMLHAINDYNGEEAWAFIPPELLDDLPYLVESIDHHYFVDNSPLAYVHDADGDGSIESGDRVILIFGLRRGGGSSNLVPTSRGSYYALDVTNPAQPKYLWHVNSETSGFGELGETWSQPRLAKMNIGGVTKVVAVFGAGYDNNEDLRFGNVQDFPTGTDITTNVSETADYGFEIGASSGGGTQFSPRGRGLYVIEVAELNVADGDYAPNFDNSGSLVWSATYGASDAVLSNGILKSNMTFSIPSDVLVFDQNHDGYADRFYVGDTGGQMWRFKVGDSNTSNWTAKRIFVANTGTSDVGRKVFYKPTATYSSPDTFIYFGTGDREHPLNYLNPGTSGGAVLDRFYMVRDRENDDNPNAPSYLTENNLVDVTTNQLQQETPGEGVVDDLLDQLYNYSPVASDGSDRTVKYGWFIKMNAIGHEGEKILAAPTIFSGAAFFTTYAPLQNTDPCAIGNLGVSRLYAVHSRTGEAIFDWYTAGGTDEFGENQTTTASKRAQTGDADNPQVLRRADRSVAIGEGIPSGLVTVIGKDGSTSILVGSGGAFPNVELDQIETVYPLYWMTW